MKCPKCGFISFDYLDQCKKCGSDLTEFKRKLRIDAGTPLFPSVPRRSLETMDQAPAEQAPPGKPAREGGLRGLLGRFSKRGKERPGAVEPEAAFAEEPLRDAAQTEIPTLPPEEPTAFVPEPEPVAPAPERIEFPEEPEIPEPEIRTEAPLEESIEPTMIDPEIPALDDSAVSPDEVLSEAERDEEVQEILASMKTLLEIEEQPPSSEESEAQEEPHEDAPIEGEEPSVKKKDHFQEIPISTAGERVLNEWIEELGAKPEPIEEGTSAAPEEETVPAIEEPEETAELESAAQEVAIPESPTEEEIEPEPVEEEEVAPAVEEPEDEPEETVDEQKISQEFEEPVSLVEAPEEEEETTQIVEAAESEEEAAEGDQATIPEMEMGEVEVEQMPDVETVESVGEEPLPEGLQIDSADRLAEDAEAAERMRREQEEFERGVLQIPEVESDAGIAEEEPVPGREEMPEEFGEEAVVIEQEVAKGGFLIRTVAGIVDLAVIVVAFVAFMLLGVFVFGLGHGEGISNGSLGDYVEVLSVPSYLLMLFLTGAYFTFFHGSMGQTLGKMICRIQVVDGEGNTLSYSKAFLRYAGWLFSTFVFLFGHLWVIFDINKQSWHDKIAGSCVIKV